jgi:hypothetical protein
LAEFVAKLEFELAYAPVDRDPKGLDVQVNVMIDRRRQRIVTIKRVVKESCRIKIGV